MSNSGSSFSSKSLQSAQSSINSNNNGKTSKTNGNDTGRQVQWTRDDDKMLAHLRKKKTSVEQIQIYMCHQPIAAIENRMKELDTKATEKPTFQRWSPTEDALLEKAIQELGLNRWSEISDIYFSSTQRPDANDDKRQQEEATLVRRRSPRSCQIRWKFLHPEVLSASSSSPSSSTSSTRFNTGPWSPEEVELFQELVNPSATAECPNDWDEISRAMGTRSAIQCHSQFKTVMHSGTKGKWTVEEVNRLLEARELFGGDWQKVAKHVGTRAPGQVRQ
ncbi:DNA binding transcription coactivator transcription factor, partial [Mortierella sp. GBA30]